MVSRSLLWLGVCISALLSALLFSERLLPGEPLDVPASALDFGTVTAVPDFEWKLPISNRSNSQIDIDRISTSCTCTVSGEQSLILKPGETSFLNLKLNLAAAPDFGAPARPFSVAVRLESTGQGLTREWILQGTVTDPIKVSPAKVEFGSVVRDRPSGTAMLEIVSKTPIVRIRVDSPTNVLVSERPASESTRRLFDVSLDAMQSLGRDTFSVRLYVSLQDGENLDLKIPVSCDVVDEIGSQPEPSYLGTVKLGERSAFHRKLFSRSDIRFRAIRVQDKPADDLQLEAVLEGDENLLLSLTPTRLGMIKFDVIIEWQRLGDELSTSVTTQTARLPFSCVAIDANSQKP